MPTNLTTSPAIFVPLFAALVACGDDAVALKGLDEPKPQTKEVTVYICADKTQVADPDLCPATAPVIEVHTTTIYVCADGREFADKAQCEVKTCSGSECPLTDTCPSGVALSVEEDVWTVETVADGSENVVVAKFWLITNTFGAWLSHVNFQIESLQPLEDQFFELYDDQGKRIGLSNPPDYQGTVWIPFVDRYQVGPAGPNVRRQFTLKIFRVPVGTEGDLRIRLKEIDYVSSWGEECRQSGHYPFAWTTHIQATT